MIYICLDTIIQDKNTKLTIIGVVLFNSFLRERTCSKYYDIDMIVMHYSIKGRGVHYQIYLDLLSELQL